MSKRLSKKKISKFMGDAGLGKDKTDAMGDAYAKIMKEKGKSIVQQTQQQYIEPKYAHPTDQTLTDITQEPKVMKMLDELVTRANKLHT